MLTLLYPTVDVKQDDVEDVSHIRYGGGITDVGLAGPLFHTSSN